MQEPNVTKEKCFVCFSLIGDTAWIGFDVDGGLYIRHAVCKDEPPAFDFAKPMRIGNNAYGIPNAHDLICDDCRNKKAPTKKQTKSLIADDVLDIREELGYRALKAEKAKNGKD